MISCRSDLNMEVNLFIPIVELKWALFAHVCFNDPISDVEMAVVRCSEIA
jgi:hypothetical protein